MSQGISQDVQIIASDANAIGAGVDRIHAGIPLIRDNRNAANQKDFQEDDFSARWAPAYKAVKRLFDIVFSLAMIVLTAIPMALVCLMIRLESAGSPIYTQKRIGKDGRIIKVLKLRSMFSDADDVEKYLNEEQLKQWRCERKVDDDPRVTKVGRIIRATSLDEIPQFLNVLSGDLSVVGPRPVTIDELNQHFTPSERRSLLSVRPGITGLWQAGERNNATFESGRRQRIELSYMRQASVATDLRVCFATAGAMFGRKKTGR